MPNNVACVLTVEGHGEDVTAFRKFAEGPNPQFKESKFERQEREEKNVREGRAKDFIPEPTVDWFQCNKFIPVPDDVLAREYGSNGSVGYNWRIDNWGTKWGAYEVGVAESRGDGFAYLAYTFVCAWSPCLPVIEAAAKRFPGVSLTLRWADPYDDSYNFKQWDRTHNRVYNEEADEYELVAIEKEVDQ